MDDSTPKKSSSFDDLVIENSNNVTELKIKLNDIIKLGKDYNTDVLEGMKSLLINSEADVLCLTVQAIAELSKCEDKRLLYGHENIIENIVKNLCKELSTENLELFKQSYRALGNLFCDCDSNRAILIEKNHVGTVVLNFKKITELKKYEDLQLIACKSIQNFMFGGRKQCESLVEVDLNGVLQDLLQNELEKEDMNDELVLATLTMLFTINYNIPDILFAPEINCAILNILKKTSDINICDECLEHLHMQAEHDSVKTLLASKGSVQLICSRIEQLVDRCSMSNVNDNSDVKSVLKSACNLIINLLTGDEAMQLLYQEGKGEVYTTMLRWMDSSNSVLLKTSLLAIGNFARKENHCVAIMENKIYDKLIDMFEVYYRLGCQMEKDPSKEYPNDLSTVNEVQYASLSAIRNLTVPAINKAAAAKTKATDVLLEALPSVKDNFVAYKLLGTLRMLVDNQSAVASKLLDSTAALSKVSKLGLEDESPAPEAARLIAWSARDCNDPSKVASALLRDEDCVACLVTMIVSPHAVMQNEAIQALTLLGNEVLHTMTGNAEHSFEIKYTDQLIKSEIGNHIARLIESNCTKMPKEVAENLLKFLKITSKKNNIAFDYKKASVDKSLVKFVESRKDLSDDFRESINAIVALIQE